MPGTAALIGSTLERLQAEAVRTKELREAVEAATARLQTEKDNPNISADNYWKPFKIACHYSQPPRAREVALDCLQKLIAHNALRGALPLSSQASEVTDLPSTPARTPLTPGNDLSQLDTSSPVPSSSASLAEPTTSKDAPTNDDDADVPPATEENGSAGEDPDAKRSEEAAAPAFTPRSTSLLPAKPSDTAHYPPNPFLIDEIIHTVCTSFSVAPSDETVQLQVLKVLLTAVTSTACEVHEVSLLKVIQTCFNIHLHSRTQVNQMTAKASLTQMVNLIFSRMERYAEVLARGLETGSMAEIENLTGMSPAGPEPQKLVMKKDAETRADDVLPQDESVESGPISSTEDEVPMAAVNDSPIAEAAEKSVAPETVDASNSKEESRKSVSDAASNPDINDSSKVVDGLESTDTQPSVDATHEVDQVPGNETSNPLSIDTNLDSDKDDQAAQTNGHAVAASPHINPASPEHQPISASPQSKNNMYDPTIAFYNEILRKDVFLVFRLLCRLSLTSEGSLNAAATTFSAAHMQEVASQPMDEISPQSTKARQLALELIMSVLNNCGTVFQSDDLYINVIRQNLCMSISRNGTTTDPTLFELSLSIFLMVTRFYRSKLKTEIEVLLNTIYLHILEMGNSTYTQKRLVLQALLKICENPQTLADIYLNYDCDMAMVSLFERIVNVCSRVAQGRDANSVPASSGFMGLAASAAGFDSKEQQQKVQERRMRLRGLCCLVALCSSLTEWSKEVAPNLPQTSLRPRKSGEISRFSTSSRDGEGRSRASESESRGTDGMLAPPKAIDGSAPPAHTANSTGSTNTAKSFLDALAPTSQANPKLIYKHPLYSVSMEHAPHGSVNGSTGSLHNLNPISPDDDSLQLENVTSRKQLMRKDVRIFNMKPKDGIKAFIKHDFVEDNAEAIARFLRVTDGLTKAAIGEYLGEGNAFNIEVMHEFIDQFDFAQTAFVDALRAFLQTFRLPGEAQKIDRIMEKFADRYYETNPEVFVRADAAYTLAFSVIMLNTDQHSPTIKVRMDKAAFLKNNRGINDGTDFPDDFLGAIFDEVSNNEIVMEEEQAGKLAQMAIGWGAGDLNDQQRMELFRKEIQQVQKKSQQLIQNASRIVAPFRTATNADLARPMFGMASWPLMAVFSLAFEAAQDDDENADATAEVNRGEPRPADLCLEGFAASIRLASIFRMETERDAFVTSLNKLTGLSHIQHIRPKNIKAIKTLIMIANVLSEYLESSWMQVLKSISHLERLQLIANRDSFDEAARPSADKDRAGANTSDSDLTLSGAPKGTITRSNTYKTIEDLTATSRPNPAVEKLIAEFHSQATVVAVDRIFTNTLNLSATAIIHFFKCLCHVSMEEVGLDPATPVGGMPQLLHSGPPRMYLLQKIVEIAYYNMPRIRFEWTQIWRILQPYFNTVACHPNTIVSTFAVDSLRQLSMKFLEREELGHYSAQNEFLRSFEWIMKNNSSPLIKELILTSMANMIAARAKSIRSGWRSIFVVLAKAAQANSGDEKMLRTAFSTVQLVFREHFEAVNNAGGFVDYIACLADFALLDGSGTTHDEVVMGSIQLLQACANYLAKHGADMADLKTRRLSNSEPDGAAPVKVAPAISSVALPTQFSGSTIPLQRTNTQPYLQANGIVSEDHFFLKWFPILSAFSRVVIDSESVPVRTKTIDALFDTLKSAGHLFDVKYWKNLQRSVILPIFSDLGERADGNGPSQPRARAKEADTAILVHGLRLYVDLTTSFFNKIATECNNELIRGVLDLLVGMLQRRDEKLATTGGICLHGLIRDNIGRFGKSGNWEVVTEGVERAFLKTVPAELLCCDYGKGLTDPETIKGDSVTSEVVKAGYQTARSVDIRVTLETLDFEHTLIKCVTHLELVQALRDIAFTKYVGSGRRNSEVRAIPDRRSSKAGEDKGLPKGDLGVPGTPTIDSKQKIFYAITIIPPMYRTRWLKCLFNSYAVARAFNEDNDLRYAIYKRGLVPQLPHLVKQETVSFSTYLRMLFAAYRAQTTGEPCQTQDIDTSESPSSDQDVLPELVKQTLDVLKRYVDFLVDQQRNQLHIGLWSPVIVMVFRELINVDGLWQNATQMTEPNGDNDPSEPSDDSTRGDSQARPHLELRKQIPQYFKLGVRMMGVDRAEVRAALQEFMERVGDEYIR
ncbi:hypothetical protein DFS34DRAFT_694406 [Phlyctochytrium arcticum]|nr:hypothetical protein DFS34DRAFT_694406 [Phlyctochytrium arcticum]